MLKLDVDGRIVNIEMQVNKEEDFRERTTNGVKRFYRRTNHRFAWRLINTQNLILQNLPNQKFNIGFTVGEMFLTLKILYAFITHAVDCMKIS